MALEGSQQREQSWGDHRGNALGHGQRSQRRDVLFLLRRDLLRANAASAVNPIDSALGKKAHRPRALAFEPQLDQGGCGATSAGDTETVALPTGEN